MPGLRRAPIVSACDTCPVPGQCCRSIILGGGSFALDAQTADEAQAHVDQVNATPLFTAVNGVMPFRPLMKRATDGAWVWWCPNLSAETGRCLDYDNRPGACRHYQPGDDAMCALFEKSPA